MSAISPFNPNQWPYSRSHSSTQEEIDQALKEVNLEKAKFFINNFATAFPSEKLELMQKLVDKLVAVNAKELTPKQKGLNYTLEAAYSVATHMYTEAANDTSSEKFRSTEIANRALTKVADAYAKKNNYHEAIHVLNRMDKGWREAPIEAMKERWKNFIEQKCPADQKERQLALYKMA